jgi:hypothetical protein
MSRLQTHVDKLITVEIQFSGYGEYLMDDKVESDIASGGLGRPKPACPRYNSMGEVRYEHQRLLRIPVVFASAWEQQASFIGFDFVFNTGSVIIHMAYLDEVTIT